MFFFKKKNIEASLDFSWLNADMHSHLIPGVDDGSPDLATSLRLIKKLCDLGYRKIITTPHIYKEFYPNTREIIEQGLAAVQKEVAQQGIDVHFHAAAEYFIDEAFEAKLKNKEPLLTLKDNLVLVEFSMVSPPLDLQQVLFDLQLNNYQPVIAHPERYSYLRKRTEVFDELKNAGCWFQVNLLSLIGYYGESVQEIAEHLIKKDYYDLAGTDLHHERHLSLLPKVASSANFRRLKESGMIKNHLL
jgi:tyrosine-protein phosphatase YwqE